MRDLTFQDWMATRLRRWNHHILYFHGIMRLPFASICFINIAVGWFLLCRIGLFISCISWGICKNRHHYLKCCCCVLFHDFVLIRFSMLRKMKDSQFVAFFCFFSSILVIFLNTLNLSPSLRKWMLICAFSFIAQTSGTEAALVKLNTCSGQWWSSLELLRWLKAMGLSNVCL